MTQVIKCPCGQAFPLTRPSTRCPNCGKRLASLTFSTDNSMSTWDYTTEGGSAHTMLQSDGLLFSETNGRPHQHEENTIPVCEMLLFQLSKDSPGWRLVKDVSREPDPLHPAYVDCIIANGSDEAWVAVTRADYSQEHYKALRKTEHAETGESASESARLLWETIEHQSLSIPAHDRAGGFLALDASQTARMHHPTVADIFRLSHDVRANELGYRAIWLLGSTDVISYRLDG